MIEKEASFFVSPEELGKAFVEGDCDQQVRALAAMATSHTTTDHSSFWPMQCRWITNSKLWEEYEGTNRSRSCVIHLLEELVLHLKDPSDEKLMEELEKQG